MHRWSKRPKHQEKVLQNDIPSDEDKPVKDELNEQDTECREGETIHWEQADHGLAESSTDGFEAVYFVDGVAKEWTPTEVDPTLFSVRKWPPYGVTSKKSHNRKGHKEPEAPKTHVTEPSEDIADDIKIQPIDFDEPGDTNLESIDKEGQGKPADDSDADKFFVSSIWYVP